MQNQNDMLVVRLLGKQEIAEDTFAFTFTKNFTFIPGQYISVYLHNDSRDFTIASSVQKKESFTIVTKKGVSTFKKDLFLLKKGDTIHVTKPAGGFLLQESKNPKVLLAGGIGITPFHSMICSSKNIKTPLILLVSFSKKEDMIFYDELQEIQKENSLIKIVYILSQDTWNGERGRISKKLIEKYVKDTERAEYMIAGGQQMVEDTEKLLLEMGIDEEGIRVDIFTGY